ncbi:hypothetical protein YQE_00674, partial [Dendroctonus ponderosae]
MTWPSTQFRKIEKAKLLSISSTSWCQVPWKYLEFPLA